VEDDPTGFRLAILSRTTGRRRGEGHTPWSPLKDVPMRKFALALAALACSFGLLVAGEVMFVKYDADKKELTVKDGDKEKVLHVTDKTTFKRGDKDVPSEKGMEMLPKMKKDSKLEVTVEKDTVTEIKIKGGKKKDN
jgi:hypothetical protein